LSFFHLSCYRFWISILKLHFSIGSTQISYLLSFSLDFQPFQFCLLLQSFNMIQIHSSKIDLWQEHPSLILLNLHIPNQTTNSNYF
jgi:hypothetical protein